MDKNKTEIKNKEDKFMSALFAQIESNKNLAGVLQEFIIADTNNHATFEEADLERKGLRKSLEMVMKGRTDNEEKLDAQLKDANAEIERLKEANKTRESQLEKISEMCSEFISAQGSIDRGLFTYASIFKYVISKLQSTIKSREAEASSYRELYNELKKEVLLEGYPGRHNDLSHEKTLVYIKGEREIFHELDKEYSKKDDFELKYRRLVACIKRLEKESYKISDGYSVCDILVAHRANEKKLKAQRKGGGK